MKSKVRIQQKKAVNKVASLLVLRFQLDPLQEHYLRLHLNCLYDLAYRHGYQSGGHGHQKKVERIKNNKSVVYKSVTSLAIMLGVDKSTISKRIKNKTVDKKGYTYKYKLDD